MLNIVIEIVQGEFTAACDDVYAIHNRTEKEATTMVAFLHRIEESLIGKLLHNLRPLEIKAAQPEPIETDRWHWWRHTWGLWGEIQSCPGGNMLHDHELVIEYQERRCSQCNAIDRRIIR